MSTKKADVATMKAMRRTMHKPRRSFLPHNEARRLREHVLKVTQGVLARALESPDTGEPVDVSTVCKWETGKLAVPLWAARRIRQLATAAKEYDGKEAQ